MVARLGRVSNRFCLLCGGLFALLILWQSGVVATGAPQDVAKGAALACGMLLIGLFLAPPKQFFLPILFLLRVGLAIAVARILQPLPIQDFDTMYQAAIQLAQGDFSYLDNIYFFHWAYQTGFVIYEAAVIFLFGDGLLPLQILNALWMGGTACLVYLIGEKFLPHKFAAAFAVLYAVYPAPLVLSGVLTNQHLCIFLLYSAIYLLIREESLCLRSAILAGVLLALGNAVRPIGIVVILAIIFFIAIRLLIHWEKRKELSLVSWGSIIASYFLAFALLSSIISFTGINPQGLSNNQPLWKFVLGFNQDSIGRWNSDDYNTLMLLPTQEGAEAMEVVVRERISVGVDLLADLAIAKSAVMWGSYEDFTWGFGAKDASELALEDLNWNQLQFLIARMDKGLYMVVFALAAVGMLSMMVFDARGATPLLICLIFCGYYAVHLIVEVQSRYRYFAMPAVFLLAGIGLSRLLPLRKKRRPTADSQ